MVSWSLIVSQCFVLVHMISDTLSPYLVIARRCKEWSKQPKQSMLILSPLVGRRELEGRGNFTLTLALSRQGRGNFRWDCHASLAMTEDLSISITNIQGVTHLSEQVQGAKFNLNPWIKCWRRSWVSLQRSSLDRLGVWICTYGLVEFRHIDWRTWLGIKCIGFNYAGNLNAKISHCIW